MNGHMEAKAKGNIETSMNDHTKIYTEVCNMIRHYSTASFIARVLCFVQGLALMATWAIYFNKNDFTLSWLLPVSGILFTGITYLFHRGYYLTVGKYCCLAADLEKKLFSEEAFRPMHNFNNYHAENYKKWFNKFFIINAPFSLIAIVFTAALIVSVLR